MSNILPKSSHARKKPPPPPQAKTYAIPYAVTCQSCACTQLLPDAVAHAVFMSDKDKVCATESSKSFVCTPCEAGLCSEQLWPGSGSHLLVLFPAKLVLN